MTDIKTQIEQLEAEMYQNYVKLQELRSQIPNETVKDYEFLLSEQESIKLSDMFNGQELLFVVHNMGAQCSACTLWADGFSGIYPVVSQSACFYLSSPDSPSKQSEIKKDRQWLFPMVSLNDNQFAKDLGFQNETGGYEPGLSLFRKADDGTIYRINQANFDAGDNFGILIHLYDLMPSNPLN